jgi:hypothetical protein
MWITLTPALFRQDGKLFGVMVCEKCDSMQGILDLGINQQLALINTLTCHHSKAFVALFPRWQSEMNLPKVDINAEKVSLFQNENIKTTKMKSGVEDGFFLGAFQENGQISMLHTISKKMTIPYCSKCSTRPCPCFQKFKKHNTEDEGSEQSEDVHEESQESPWEKEKNSKSPVEHFENEMELQDWYDNYGCNFTKIDYPIKRDPIRQEAWIQIKMGREPDFPEGKLIPSYKENLKCAHKNKFSQMERHLVKISDKIIIYNSQSEKVYDKHIYARGTGLCKCLQQVDGDKMQLWHIRGGRFIDYTYIKVHFAM